MSAFEWRVAPRARFAVIGDPVAHSLSPQMQNAALRHLGLDGEYVAVRVSPDEVLPALDHLARLGYEGLNVTVPLKREVFPWLQMVEGFSMLVEAVNTIRVRDRSGVNTDAPGFLQVVQELGIAPGSRVLVLGAGGSARAIATILVQHGYELTIYNRTAERARELAGPLGAEVVEKPATQGFQLVVNTTSATLEGAELPIEWASAEPGGVACDLMYGKQSQFLERAAQHGFQTVDGKPLLVAQGALAFEFWTGQKAPRDVMMEAIT